MGQSVMHCSADYLLRDSFPFRGLAKLYEICEQLERHLGIV